MALSLKIYQKRALSSLESYLDDARLKGPAQAFEGNVDKGLLVNTSLCPASRTFLMCACVSPPAVARL